MSASAVGAVAGAAAATDKRKPSCADSKELLEKAEEAGILLEQTLAEKKEATEESRRRLCRLKAKLKAAMGR
jgi:hypothetical protein